MITIIQAVRDYISTCPLLKNGVILGIDQLNKDMSYTIDTTPCPPIIQKYTDGSTKRQFQFVFASRERYGTRVLENLENSGFFENFSAWIDQNNWNRNFPDLGEFRKPYRLEILTNGYVFDTGDNTARYQIQLNLLYTQNWRFFNG